MCQSGDSDVPEDGGEKWDAVGAHSGRNGGRRRRYQTAVDIMTAADNAAAENVGPGVNDYQAIGDDEVEKELCGETDAEWPDDQVDTSNEQEVEERAQKQMAAEDFMDPGKQDPNAVGIDDPGAGEDMPDLEVAHNRPIKWCWPCMYGRMSAVADDEKSPAQLMDEEVDARAADTDAKVLMAQIKLMYDGTVRCADGNELPEMSTKDWYTHYMVHRPHQVLITAERLRMTTRLGNKFQQKFIYEKPVGGGPKVPCPKNMGILTALIKQEIQLGNHLKKITKQ
jgi:hypothetical protein